MEHAIRNETPIQRSRVRIAMFFAALMLAAATIRTSRARAEAPKPEPPYLGDTKLERYFVEFDVNADGSHVERREWTLRVLTDEGVAQANSAPISYSARLATADILSAYTLKKDGRRIDVPASNFQEQTNTGRGSAPPIFTDVKTVTVAFPEVAVGDATVLSYKLTQKEATYPGNFSMTESFSKFEVFELEDRTPGNVCSPAVVAAEKSFAVGVLKDVRAQLIYN